MRTISYSLLCLSWTEITSSSFLCQKWRKCVVVFVSLVIERKVNNFWDASEMFLFAEPLSDWKHQEEQKEVTQQPENYFILFLFCGLIIFLILTLFLGDASVFFLR